MKCLNCGAEIPEDQIRCPVCGQDLQIVPDYNPLDDVLAAQVKGALSETMAFRSEGARAPYRQTGRTASLPGGAKGSSYRQESGRGGRAGQKSPGTGKAAQTGRAGTAKLSPEERRRRQQQAEKKRRLARKKKKQRLVLCLVVLAALVAAGIFLYQNSYQGLVKSGDRYFAKEDYKTAEEKYTKARKKDRKRGEAYTGMANIYIKQGKLDTAEQMFLDAIDAYGSDVEIYRAAIQFYIDSGQEDRIAELLDDCSSERVLEQLDEYMADTPQFSLDETVEYDEVQALELKSEGKEIYYTTNGEKPSVKTGTRYTEPIRLDEGETEVKAISVNEKGIPSLVVSRTYTVSFPIADAPAVSPSTGQYEGARTIEVEVPSNFEAYYTTDGTTPTKSSHPYTGPIDMPMGKTIFSVVLVDQSGRLSDVTIRNYERTE